MKDWRREVSKEEIIVNRTVAMRLAVVAGLSLMLGAACSSPSVESRDETSGAAATSQSTTTQRADVAHSSSPSTFPAQPPLGQAPADSSGAYPAAAPRVPGGTPIETSAYDTEIKRLEQAVSKRANDAQAQQALASAYATRAARLTEAQQYRAALGDWRRAIKLDPANEQAQDMIATITGIMESMNRPVPAPGEEPAPLPFKQ